MYHDKLSKSMEDAKPALTVKAIQDMVMSMESTDYLSPGALKVMRGEYIPQHPLRKALRKIKANYNKGGGSSADRRKRRRRIEREASEKYRSTD